MTWNKLGRPQISASKVGPILLSNNAELKPEGVVETKIKMGNRILPVKFLVMNDKGWNYDVIVGMDFLEHHGCVIDCRKKTVGCGSARLNAVTILSQIPCHKRFVVMKEKIKIPEGHQARVKVEIRNACPFTRYWIEGTNVIPGYYETTDQKDEIVVFLNAPTKETTYEKDQRIAIAEEIETLNVINAMRLDLEREKKIEQLKIKIGKASGLNQFKMKGLLKEYSKVMDGLDPNLVEMRNKRKENPFWNSPESKGRIFTPNDCRPVYIPQYRQPPNYMEDAEQKAEAWEKDGLIRKSFSSWNAPVLMVPKPDGTLRFCVDYRQLNKLTASDSYPMPRIDEILDSLGKSCVFSKLDLQWGFYNIELAEEDKHKTAFSTRRQHWEWNVLPMGLKNSLVIFQRIMTPYIKTILKSLYMFLQDNI